MDEFDWIETYLRPLAGPEGLNLLDDAALFQPSPNQDLVLTQDTLVEGVHFFSGNYGAGTAERLMAVNLSDLAAKGARPLGYLLSVTWPSHLDDKDLKKWMAGFCKGLETQQNAYDFKLFGGDTVRSGGPMTISASFMGAVPKGEMVTRSGAQIGDDVWVTGTIGDAHLGLLMAKETPSLFEHSPSGNDLWQWEEAFRHPKPRLLFRKILRQYATACADISDGLFSEAAHIAKASRAKLTVNLKGMPLSNASHAWCEAGDEQSRKIQLATGGDDYELLFTARANDGQALLEASETLGLKLTRVGRVEDGEGINVLGRDGVALNLPKLGYSHF